MNKAVLRKLRLERRALLSAKERASAGEQIAEMFFETVDLADVYRLHTFVPIPRFHEIDTSIISRKLWRDRPDVVIAAPRTDLSSGEIESVVFDAATAWVENAWGIREPMGGETVEASEIDVVIVPLLCFDKSGHRVGYGKGMYDRFLARCRPDCLKVGLDYFEPIDEMSDSDATDIRLDMCVTPERFYRFFDVSEPPA